MNLSDPPHKVSNIERMLNKYIVALFLVLVSLSATGSLLFGSWLGSESTAKMWYLAPPPPLVLSGHATSLTPY